MAAILHGSQSREDTEILESMRMTELPHNSSNSPKGSA